MENMLILMKLTKALFLAYTSQVNHFWKKLLKSLSIMQNNQI